MVNEAYIIFLNEAADYFEQRPTNGEDRAYWSNVFNAETCRKIAKELGANSKDYILLQEKYDEQVVEVEQFRAANRDLMLHWEVLRSDYDTIREKYQKLVFYLAHIDLDYFTEHDQALLDSAIEEAKKEVLPEQNND